MTDSSEKLNAEAEIRRKNRLRKSKTNNNGSAKYTMMTRSDQQRRMHELKSRFLSHKSLPAYVEKLFEIAMDDDHDGQMAAMKLLADRLLPVAGFSSEGNKSSAVQINITGLQVEKVEEKEVVSIQ